MLAPQPTEQADGDLVQGDRAAAAGRLGWPEQILAVDHDQLLVHGQCGGVEVDVGPPQRRDLAAAKAGQGDQPPQREQRVAFDGTEEGGEVLAGPHRHAGRAPVSRHAVSRVVVHTTGRTRLGLGSRTFVAGLVSIRPCRTASDRALRNVARIRSSVEEATSRPDRVRPEAMIRNAACSCAARRNASRIRPSNGMR
jgi:hypothetical protein